MPTDQTASNKATLRRFCDALNSGDMQVISNTIDELVEPEANIRTGFPVDATGAEKLKEVFRTLHRAYPDLHVQVEVVIAERDTVFTRNTVTGTHRGEYMGLPPTGKSVTYDEMFVFRVAGGRIAETWGIVDVLSQLRQLGAVSAPRR
jgi:steroid delta-isomerase-like uncharacterized protein